jgi:hypothetical protein
MSKIEKCFKKEGEEINREAWILNSPNMAFHMGNAGFPLEPPLSNIAGPILRCFGNMRTKDTVKIIEPPEPTEEVKQPAKGARARRPQEKEQQVALVKTIDDGVVVEFQKDQSGNLTPVTYTFQRTSLNEFEKAFYLMGDFEKTLFKLGLIKGSEVEVEIQQEEEVKIEKQPSLVEEGRGLSSAGGRGLDRRDSVGSHLHMERRKSSVKEEPPNKDYMDAVSTLDDLDTIPDPPERAKNAFSLDLYCMEEAFEPFGVDFLESAFDLFPERDYLILTQPHTVAENSLMRFFTLAPKKPNNTFQEVLYLMHRSMLLYKDIKVRLADLQDLDQADYLLQALSDDLSADQYFSHLQTTIKDSILLPEDSPYRTFAAKCQGDVIGLFVVSTDVNLEYYRSHFKIEDYIQLELHDRADHTRLLYSLINPIFLRCQRLILTDILRLMAKSCLYMEVRDDTVIPPLFHDLVHVPSRRFPHFLKKPWDHEGPQHEDPPPMQDGGSRFYMDQEESDFSLAFISKKLLSEPKSCNNTRILVIGASDTGLSFIETLISIPYINFSNIYLLAPGGLPYHHVSEERQNLKSASNSYTLKELGKLLLENRVNIVDGRIIELLREEKKVVLHDDTVLCYDYLILTLGLVDRSLQKLGYMSRGIVPIPPDKMHVEGVLSIDDPYLYQHLRPNGSLMGILNHRKYPGTLVVYGYSFHAYCFIQGMLEKGINPIRIKLLLTQPDFEAEEGIDPLFGGDENILGNHVAFEGDTTIESVQHSILAGLGITILPNTKLIAINKDEKTGHLQSIRVSMDDGSEETVNCKVLVTCGESDVDTEVFKLIHENGLVFNGRIIVDSQFRSTDERIYSGGSLVEFSHQYRNETIGRCLRMDRYCGKEVGINLARSFLRNLDSQAFEGAGEADDSVPTLYMAKGKGGMLPGGYHYYYIASPRLAEPVAQRNLPANRLPIVSNTLDIEAGTGHYIKFEFNNIGLIDAVTYYSKEPIVVQSLWSFVGLSETYLNKLTSRFQSGIIQDVAEFLSENWAIALYHDCFADFSLNLRVNVKAKLGDLLEQVGELAEKGKNLTREDFERLQAQVPVEIRQVIEEYTVDYIRKHQNHLPMYFIPDS